MLFFKSALAGIATAFLVMIVSLVLFFVVSATLATSQVGIDYSTSGSGGIGAVSVGLTEISALAILLFSVAGFALGFWWQFTRGAKVRPIEP